MVSMSNERKERNILKLILIVRFACVTFDVGHPIPTIQLHAFLQSLHPFEKNCVQGLLQDFHQNNPNTNKKFRWSFSAISHQLSFDVADKEKSEGAKSGE
jgi:hypothetical protein